MFQTITSKMEGLLVKKVRALLRVRAKVANAANAALKGNCTSLPVCSVVVNIVWMFSATWRYVQFLHVKWCKLS